MAKILSKEYLKKEQNIIKLVSLFVTIGLFICLSPFFFFEHMDLPLGILLGGLVGLLSYQMLIYQINSTLRYKHPRLRGIFNYLLRWLFYLIGLLACLIPYHFGYYIFNVFTTCGGYFIVKIVMVIVSLKTKKEVNRNEENL
ncbi:MAG: hypothetical protein ACI311_07100 [Bacilli bacterium]